MTEDNPGASLEPLGSRYLLETAIGSGAMGQVWRATTRDGEPVAIKVLRPELSSDAGVVSRFLQERHILEGLDEPHLVRMRDLVAEGSKLAIVMDLVEGPDLRTELTRRGTFRPIEAAEIVDGLLAGLSAVHAAGVVHRDVKPENVLLAGGQPGGARLTDFGVARIVEESQKARRTTVIGTPEYLAPEVADGAEPTAASDLYAAGVVLYELVAGVTPFAGGSPLAVLRRHADQAPVRPEGMPDGIWDAVSALLAKSPSQRPGSASEVRERLAAAAPAFASAPALRPLTEPPAPAVVSQPTVMGLRTETQAMPVVDPEPAPQPQPRTRRTGLLVGLVALVLVLLVGGGVTAFALTRGNSSTHTQDAATGTTAAEPSAATSTEAAATSTSASPTAGVVPAVTGMPLADAQTAITNAGYHVQISEQLSDSATDNTVTAQDPQEGATLEPNGTVTLTVARRAVGVFLADLHAVQTTNYSPQTGTATTNGKTYVHGVSAEVDCGGPTTFQYDLGRHYQSFVATAGPSDDSGSSTLMQIDVVIDGRSVFSQRLALGQSAEIKVDVTGGLRLALTATRVEPNCNSYPGAHVVWGDAEVFGSPDEVASATATASPTD